MSQDRLFISYAGEDEHVAEWLALRLTAEGYGVWCDRFQLLGGESYPKDIDDAIKQRTFRVIALLSKSSISKPNPLKERTLALNIARERQIDFLIPLNVDGLSSTELDWMTSDLSYISFYRGWAEGFARLLKKLESIYTPKPLVDGRRSVVDWFSLSSEPQPKTEQLWTNLFQISSLPTKLYRFGVAETFALPPAQANWPYYRNHDAVWTFEPEPPPGLDTEGVAEFDWMASQSIAGLWLPNVATSLVRKHLRALCLSRGLRETPDRKHMYFPFSDFANSWLSFPWPATGQERRLRGAGTRRFRVVGFGTEVNRYHLAVSFVPALSRLNQPMVAVHPSLHLTDATGTPLEPGKAHRRRAKICRMWWNYEWLARVLAVGAHLFGTSSRVELTNKADPPLALASLPVGLSVDWGIDEDLLSSAVEADDDVEIDDESSDTSTHEVADE